MSQLDTNKCSPKPNFSPLFHFIEECQRECGKPFNEFLDAGTGTDSLRWIAQFLKKDSVDGALHARQCTAVTVDEYMLRRVKKEARKLDILDKCDIVLGDWFSDAGPFPSSNADSGNGDLSEARMYDTILVDYLISAMDGFTPYFQDLIFSKLNHHLAPGGRLYILELQPFPHGNGTQSESESFIGRVCKTCDACILLAGERCYREYPDDWMIRQLGREPDLSVVKVSRFPIHWSHKDIKYNLDDARTKLPDFPSEGLAKQMREVLDDLEKESKTIMQASTDNKVQMGFNYIIVVEKEDLGHHQQKEPS